MVRTLTDVASFGAVPSNVPARQTLKTEPHIFYLLFSLLRTKFFDIRTLVTIMRLSTEAALLVAKY